jgi:hypothetical protein
MSLSNPINTQFAIAILLNDEKTIDSKLDLLTSITLGTTNEETIKICEDFRYRLASSEGRKNKGISDEEALSERQVLLHDDDTEGSKENNREHSKG